jgi:hypothetical protein
MDCTSDMGHKGSDCVATVDAVPVENLAQMKAHLSREVRKFLKQYDTEGSKKKQLKREEKRKVMDEMQRQTKEMFRVSEAIRLKTLRLREQSAILLEQIEDDLRSLDEDTHEAPP